MTWLLHALILLACVGAASVVATAVMTRMLEARNPPVGELTQVGDTQLHLVDSGRQASTDAPSLLLLHGANLDLRDMQLALGAALASRFRTILVDRPGQGYSALGRRDALAPDKQVSLLRAAVTGRGVGRVIIVGHSLGGLIALRYVLAYPDEVVGLVLVNPTSHPRENDLLPRQKLAGRLLGPAMAWTCVVPLSGLLCAMFARRLFEPQSAPAGYAEHSGLALGMTPRRLQASLAEYEGLRAELARAAPLYPHVKAPTVILAGGADRIVPAGLHAQKLARDLPDATLVEIPDAGHMAHHGRAAIVHEAIDRIMARATA